MLTYRDILNSITRKLSSVFDGNIYTTEQTQGFNESCFFVQISPMTSVISTRKTDKKRLMIELKYYGSKNRLEAYDRLDKLSETFVRGIKVQDRYLSYSSIDTDINKDDVGYIATMLLFIDYHETVIKEDIYENMQEINIR